MDPDQLKYAKTHEWISIEGDVATIGISDFAVKELTDIVDIEFPSVGNQIAAGETFGEVESVKAVSDLYAPVSGEVIEVKVIEGSRVREGDVLVLLKPVDEERSVEMYESSDIVDYLNKNYSSKDSTDG